VRIPSSDHVSVAVHDFGGSGPPLLFSHATGFHGYCYLPIADHLTDRFRTYALDYRGHGDTARPDDWEVDWSRYGDDAEAASMAVAPSGGLIGFGHSMGGSGLLMAAARHPGLFDLIVAFEPIILPPDADTSGARGSVMSDTARRRRASFASFEAAQENFASKPPMASFDPDVLRLYVAHGFRPAPEGVRLACDPEHEARTFEANRTHDTWDRLPDISTRVIVVTSDDGDGPALFAPRIAERLANAKLVELPDTDHFWPYVDPRSAAELISSYA
jgi:pimeloyl-ACP methyl ester carboxylesterase